MDRERTEWERAAGAGRVRSRRALLRMAVIGAGILLGVVGIGGAIWWQEIGSRKPAGASCEGALECATDALCVEGICTPRCGRGGSKCGPGLVCVDVRLKTEGPVRSFAGRADLCVPVERAPSLRETP